MVGDDSGWWRLLVTVVMLQVVGDVVSGGGCWRHCSAGLLQ